MKFTDYYIRRVHGDRPYIKDEWCQRIIENPVRTQVQENGRIQYWGYVAELGKYMRVITLEDGETLFNAFPDRRFKP